MIGPVGWVRRRMGYGGKMGLEQIYRSLVRLWCGGSQSVGDTRDLQLPMVEFMYLTTSALRANW